MSAISSAAARRPATVSFLLQSGAPALISAFSGGVGNSFVTRNASPA
jgi:hypothetical protein